MLLNWLHFFILQATVIVVFFIKHNKEEFLINKLFRNRWHFAVFNTSIFLLCYSFNSERQLFCRPVPWAAALIIPFCISFIILPFVRGRKLLFSVLTLLCGTGIFIAIYILLFSRWEYLFVIVMAIFIGAPLHFLLKFLNRKFTTHVFNAFYLYPAFLLTPVFLLIQLWHLFRSLLPVDKRIFLIAPAAIILISLAFTWQIRFIIHEISTSHDKEARLKQITANPVNSYLTELILGAHWKYHTQLCLFDGWRPPFHDPVLVIANKILYPDTLFYQGTQPDEAQRLYTKIFPGTPTRFDCRCAKHERLFDL